MANQAPAHLTAVNTNADQFNTFLDQCETTALTLNTPPMWVYPKIISFKNGQTKTNWLPHLHSTNHTRACYSDFTRDKDLEDGVKNQIGGTPQAKIGLFNTPTGNWVKHAGNWGDLPWHVWGVLMVSAPQGSTGKHYLLWDCNAVPDDATTKRRSEYMNADQIAFITATETAGSTFWWAGGELDGEDTRDLEKCVEYGTKWVLEMLQYDGQRYQGVDDPRFDGAVQIVKK